MFVKNSYVKLELVLVDTFNFFRCLQAGLSLLVCPTHSLSSTSRWRKCCIQLYYLKLIWAYQQFISVSWVRGIERQVNLELLTIHSHALSGIQCLILLLWSQPSILAPLWLLYSQTCSSSSTRSLLIQASVCSPAIILSCFPLTPSSDCDSQAGIVLRVH